MISHSAALYGAQRSLYDLAVGLRALRVEVVATAPERGPLTDLLNRSGIATRILPCRNWVHSRTSYHWMRKFLIAKNQAKKASRWIADDRFDIVHTNSVVTPVGAMAAKRAGLPHVWHVREGMPPKAGFFYLGFDRVRQLIEDTTFKMVGISKHSCEGMRTFCPDEKIKLIYNGPLEGDQAREPLSERSFGDKIQVLCVGRASVAKGHDVAARAVARLRRQGHDATLTIAGDIPTDFHRELDSILPEGLITPGYLADPTSLYKSHNVLAMASQREAFGRVTVEAMSHGCVVIGSDSGATPEIIEHGVSGLLFAAGNEVALADEILSLKAKPSFYQSIREEGRRQVFNRFTRDRYAREVNDIYREVVRTV